MGLLAFGTFFSVLSNAMWLVALANEGKPFPPARLALTVVTLAVFVVALVMWLKTPRDPNRPNPSLWRTMRAFVLREIRR